VNRKADPPFFRAVVFDFDGTLARLNIDFSVMRTSIRNLMTDFRIPPETGRNLHVLEMIDAGCAYLGALRPKEAPVFRTRAHELVIQTECEAAEEGALFDDTRALLSELAAHAIGAGVVTRNSRKAVLTVFPDIARCCQAVLTRDDTRHVKPHPDHLLSALAILGVPPTEAVMVGDHPLDIHLGRAAGTYTIGVLTGHAGRAELDAAQADQIIDKASDIIYLYFK
jgi:phosphoglycolate phosphatase